MPGAGDGGSTVFQVFDAHAHIGVYGGWNCPAEALVRAMDARGVRWAVVGDPASNAFGAKAFEETARVTDAYPGRLFPLLWVNPALPGDIDFARRAAESGRAAGMKAHPQTCRVRLGDERFAPYMEICRKFNLTFAAHTEADGYSDMDGLMEMADEYPDVRFVAVHMEFRSDHRRAIREISKRGNVYGDTTFVPSDDVLYAVETLGAERVVFGSDAPVIGSGCYDALKELADAVLNRFGPDAAERVFRENGKTLYRTK